MKKLKKLVRKMKKSRVLKASIILIALASVVGGAVLAYRRPHAMLVCQMVGPMTMLCMDADDMAKKMEKSQSTSSPAPVEALK